MSKYISPIIFLDIYGVLHSFNYEEYLTNHNFDWFDKDGAVFDPNCIVAFEYLINATKAKIVISSSWKDSRFCENALPLMRGIWERRELPGDIIDITPTLTPDDLFALYGIRSTWQWKGYEIDQWLKHNRQYRSYIIIDDQDVVLDNQRDFFIKTNGKKGLQKKDVDKAMKILGQCGDNERKANIMTWIGNLLHKK